MGTHIEWVPSKRSKSMLHMQLDFMAIYFSEKSLKTGLSKLTFLDEEPEAQGDKFLCLYFVSFRYTAKWHIFFISDSLLFSVIKICWI